ncbi:hypothetical protein [Sphingomonas sp. Leaf412]|uniref:hypothetical protein n=1 Tax=Sphingomonas sp. Leaf412 TaxID=1736370 RepID=UPI000B167E3F|nr:hypothetical protein [Sphingomonas sp. Leaf412]
MTDIPALWFRFVQWIGDGTGLPDAILHIHAGMAVLIVARVLTGRGLGTFIPFWFVVAAETANEVLDRMHYGSWRWPDTTLDVFNTLWWPLVLTIGVRLRPMPAKDRRRR